MTRALKIWLITAALLILLGALLFVGVMAAAGWDLSGLSGTVEQGSIPVGEAFERIVINGDTQDLRILPSEDGVCRVDYALRRGSASAIVSGGTLTVELQRDTAWYRDFFQFGDSKVTLLVPMASYEALAVNSSTGDIEIAAGLRFESVEIELSTGDIRVLADASAVRVKGSTGNVTLENAEVGSLTVSLSTGDVRLSSVACPGTVDITVSTGRVVVESSALGALSTNGDTGDLTVKDTAISGAVTVERTTGDVDLYSSTAAEITVKTSTGDVSFRAADAGEITVTTSTGDVRGTLRTEKIFIPRTSSGKIRVPETLTGGPCRITTSTGDIEITIE